MPLHRKRGRTSAQKDAQRVTDGMASLQQSATDSEVEFLAEHFRSEPDLTVRIGALVRNCKFFQLLSQVGGASPNENKKTDANKQFHKTARKFKHSVSQVRSVATKIIAALEPDLFEHLAGISKKDLGGDKDLPTSVSELLCYALSSTHGSDLCWTTIPLAWLSASSYRNALSATFRWAPASRPTM